jgi:GNAT superfamily N-acetyltransferase
MRSEELTLISRQPTIRRGNLADLNALEPLWKALHDHHATVLPELGAAAPRPAADSWAIRREKYKRWLDDPATLLLRAEESDVPIGYAFVTVGPAYACWDTGAVAELQTLSVLPEWRDAGIGTRLIDAVWAELEKRNVADLAITTVATNLDSHRFYERHGFKQAFVVYHGHR